MTFAATGGLGEGASPFADTISGHVTPAALVKKNTGGTDMTDDVTGALPTADDDGAVQFNAFLGSEYLNTDSVDSSRFYFTDADDAVTVAAWIKPAVGSTANPATVAGIWMNFLGTGGVNSGCGYRLGVNYPALTAFFQRRSNDGGFPESVLTGPPLDADTWYFVVGTYDAADGHCLYINGALSDSDPTTFQLGHTEFGGGFHVGYGVNTGAVPVTAIGGADEVSVWGDALTLGEVAELVRGRDQRRRRRRARHSRPPILRLPARPAPWQPREASGMYRVPFPAGEAKTYTLDYASLHLGEAGSSTTTLVIEKSETTDEFTPETIVTLSCATTVHLDEETAGLGTLESGNLLRFTWTAIGTGADMFHAQLEGEET